jgi:hypothetical protein
MEEIIIWAKVPFTDKFIEVSNIKGLVRNGDTKELLKTYLNNKYRHFSTLVNGKKKTVYVHRCVLAAHKYI